MDSPTGVTKGASTRVRSQCRIPSCCYNRRQKGSTIDFDTGEALTLTLIGIGTAFSLLAFLLIFTTVLPYIARMLVGWGESLPGNRRNQDERDKALAAAIAVNIVLTEGGAQAMSRANDEVTSQANEAEEDASKP